jgi:hypothetical protein
LTRPTAEGRNIADVPQEFDSKTREAFFEDCKGKYSNIVAIYRHNDSVASIGLFDKELINALPKSLKYICHNGAGYDQSALFPMLLHKQS